MVTNGRKIIIVFLVTLLATPLSREVFAQVDEMSTSTEAAEIESVSEELSENSNELEVPKVIENWYRSDRISGRIDVGDFVVGPGRTEISVKPGETVIQEVSVTNRISDGRRFKIEVEDITGSRDGSSAVSLTGNQRGPYSIRDYISFPEDEFTLELGERAWIPVKISIPEDGEPGGFYGSILISTIQDDGVARAGEAPRSPIVARVGSLFFITVEGDALIEGQTKDLSLVGGKWWYEKGPIDMAILYENTGSVHVNPYGEMTVTNMFGEEVGHVELPPWFVLPMSLRAREVSWDREFLLGRYTATAKINRGYDNIIDEISVSFWVMPWKVVGGVFFVLFLIFFSIRAFFRTFEFKRKGS